MKTNKSFLNSAVYSLAVLAFTVGCTKKRDDAKALLAPKTELVDPKIDQVEQQVEAKEETKPAAPAKPVEVVEQKKEEVITVKPVEEVKVKEEAKPVVVAEAPKAKEEQKVAEVPKVKEAPAAPTKQKQKEPAAPADNSPAACMKRMNTKEKIVKRKEAYEKQMQASTDSEYNKILEQRKGFEKLRAERIQAKAKSNGQVAKAADSDEIKSKPSLKISFKNFKLLLALSDTDNVLFNSKVVDAKTAEAKLEKGNEGHFCRVEGAYAFNAEDSLEVTDGTDKFLVNKDKDIYDTRLDFTNKNGKLTFVCNHAGQGFFVQDFAGNFKDYLEVKANTTVMTDKDFVNPYEEDRRLEAIQLLDTAKLEKIVLTEKTTEGMALSKGEVVSADKISTEIAAGNEKIGCMINDKQGEFDKKKVYIRVDKGIAQETPANIPYISVYAIYRADKDSSFVLTCMVDKRTSWSALFNTAKNVIKFGALDRVDFNKKSAEVIRIHEGLQKPIAVDLSNFEVNEVDCLKEEAAEADSAK